MTGKLAKADDGQRPPVLTLIRPRCPACDSTRLWAYKSTTVDEGTTVRYSRCQNCGKRLVIWVQ
jgi:formate dehydrogenase maturation protein FdhE